MTVRITSLSAVSLMIVLWSGCSQKEKRELSIRQTQNYKEYKIDSAVAENTLIWAVDNGISQAAIDTLKPMLRNLDSLAHKFQDSAFWSIYIYTLFDIGLEYEIIDQYDSAYPYLQKSYELSKSLWGEEILIVTMCLNKLAFYFSYKGDYTRYHECLFKSYDIRRRILDKNDFFLALGLGNMAAYFYDIGDHLKEKLYAEKALEIYQRHFEIWKYSIDSIKKDSLYKLYGYMPTLPKTIHKMLTGIPNRYAAFLYNKMEKFVLNNDYKMARLYNDELDSIILKYPSIKPTVARYSTHLRAKYQLQTGNIERALILLDSLVLLYEEDHHDPSDIYNLKADFLIQAGRYADAKKIINDKINIGTSKSLKAFKFQRLALICLKEENFNEAIHKCDSANKINLGDSLYRIFRNNEFMFNRLVPFEANQLLNILHYEILARYGLLDSISSIDEKQKIISLFDQLNSGMVFLQENNYSEEGKIRQESDYYPEYEKAINLASDLYAQTADKKYVDYILKWSESHKAIALMNVISQKRELYTSDAFPKPVQELNDLYMLYNGIKNKLLKLDLDTIKADRNYRQNLLNSLEKTNSDIDVLKEKNKDIVSAYLNPMERINYPEEEIKKYLKEKNAVLIDYFIGNDKIHITLVSNQEETVYSTKLKQADYKSIDSFNLFNRKFKGPVDTGLSRRIYDLILGPIENKLTSKHLIIIPDGILYRIPFESLVDSSGRILLEKHSIQYEYSSKLLLKKGFKESRSNYAGFAPDYTGHEEILVSSDESKILEDTYAESRAMLGALKFNVPEVVQGAKIIGGKSFIGPIVDKLSFKEHSRDARIVHLAMHAITDDRNADYSQLFFKSKEGNEPLFAYELNEYEMHTELAILSACNTGVGDYRRGDGVKSIARAFKAAGCKNILMSLWPANDASTKDIVIGFLENLKAGMGKADALRQSKLNYLKSATTELQKPYYWAGLVLIGDNDPMNFSKSFNILYWSFIILIIMFLLFQVGKILRK